MIPKIAHLSESIFNKDIEKKPTRDGFGTGTVEAGREDKNILVLCADLAESTRAEWFQKEFPDRFIEMGIAEQNMASTAAGFALAGKIPFIASYAAFSPGRNYEQIRTTVALNETNVKIAGMHAGISVGPDGATHQMLEDIGLMRMLPNMKVIVPGDAIEAHKAVVAAAKIEGPVYIRFGRTAVPSFTTNDTPFIFGKALTVWEDEIPKITIFSTGIMTHTAILAARALSADGIGVLVVHVATVKPLDVETIVSAAKKTGKVITLEEHQIAGGFGSAITECLSQMYPVPIVRMGLDDVFGQSGEPDELLTHYGLTVSHITERVRRFVGVK